MKSFVVCEWIVTPYSNLNISLFKTEALVTGYSSRNSDGTASWDSACNFRLHRSISIQLSIARAEAREFPDIHFANFAASCMCPRAGDKFRDVCARIFRGEQS